MKLGTATVIQANARHLPLEDNTVDLVVTSPPYFALRSYQDTCAACRELERTGDNPREAFTDWPEHTRKFHHYDGQIGSEPTPAEFVDALIEVTHECMRVLKPSGSLWVNLGDKYTGSGMGGNTSLANSDDYLAKRAEGYHPCATDAASKTNTANATTSTKDSVTPASMRTVRKPLPGLPRSKSLIGIPWRYALRCIDDLGLILRAEVIWSKPNGLPESVTDRVRRSHEQWFHFTLNPRYYSAVDEIREAHVGGGVGVSTAERKANGWAPNRGTATGTEPMTTFAGNPLGKLPGSVWTIPTEPLTVPDHLGVDHFAAFPTEFPKRIIAGWSPAGVCTACGAGRRPVTHRKPMEWRPGPNAGSYDAPGTSRVTVSGTMLAAAETTITGYACACPAPTIGQEVTEFDYATETMVTRTVEIPDPTWVNTAPTTPGVVLDPFGGTGTTAMVAKALGRHGITVDMSADYCRLARWRTTDRNQLAKVLGIEKVPAPDPAQLDLFGEAVS